MITEKQILNSSGYAIIEFKVTGTMILSKSDVYRNMTRGLRQSLASVLGLKRSLIEMKRPNEIPNGLQITANIHLNHILSRDIDYKQLLIKCQTSGQLAEIIQDVWKLKAIPDVSQINFQVQESKNRVKNTVPIRIQSIEGEQPEMMAHQTRGNQNQNFGEVNNYNSGNIELEPMPHMNVMNVTNTAGHSDDESSDSHVDGNTTFGVNTVGNDHNTPGDNGDTEPDNDNNDAARSDNDVIQYINETAKETDFEKEIDGNTLM